jgi:anti-anti-sigma factor
VQVHHIGRYVKVDRGVPVPEPIRRAAKFSSLLVPLKLRLGSNRRRLERDKNVCGVILGRSIQQPDRQNNVGKSFQYTYLDLKDAGEVLVARFKQTSILDQAVSDEIACEFDQAELEASANRKLLLDFQGVEYMSSAMLGKLIQLHKRCKADKIKLKLCSISSNPLDVFKITRLDKLFEIHKDVATALATFG